MSSHSASLKTNSVSSHSKIPSHNKKLDLFACVICNDRYAFEELSSDLMLCKNCVHILVLVKCMYCRSEFERNTLKNKSKSTVCSQCELKLKTHGKPQPCEYCKLDAAFNKDKKCARCADAERKHGPPLSCDQCKKRCSFTNKNAEARKKVGGQRLCWVCSVAYKRALAKSKYHNNKYGANSTKSTSSQPNKHSLKHKDHNHHHNSTSSSSTVTTTTNSTTTLQPKQPLQLPGKPAQPRQVIPQSSSLNFSLSSDKVAEVAQLREKILSLEKQLDGKNQDSYLKDVQISKLENDITTEQQSSRELIAETQRKNNDRVMELQQKIDALASNMNKLKRK